MQPEGGPLRETLATPPTHSYACRHRSDPIKLRHPGRAKCLLSGRLLIKLFLLPYVYRMPSLFNVWSFFFFTTFVTATPSSLCLGQL